MKRTIIVAGNWKMNKTREEVNEFLNGLTIEEGDSEVIIACASPFLGEMVKRAQTSFPRLKVSAQNCHHEASGAFTGEISASMIRSVGAEVVIIGHSERRSNFGDTDEWINRKCASALEEGLRVIFCCGETLDEREAGDHFRVVESQIRKGLGDHDLENVIIAYEPVWAIGTGVTASPEQAEEMHAFIRSLLEESHKGSMRILYGGSVKPENFKELLAKPNIDGGLVGGASLDAESFGHLVRIGDMMMS